MEAHTTAMPRNVGPLQAMRRHWFLALLPVAALVAAAVVLGLNREPEYTARADLSVGPVFVSNPAGIASVLQGTASMASVYSRAIAAGPVKDDVARAMSARSGEGLGSLSATPVPDSPLIKVTATGSTGAGAVALANAGATALADYAKSKQRDAQAKARRVTQDYRRIALLFRQRVEERDRLAEEYDKNPTRANRAALDRAGAAADTVQLRRNALVSTYQNNTLATSATPPIEIFARATTAGDDRYQVLQVLLFVGLLGGVAGGAALALLRANRKKARRAPSP